MNATQEAAFTAASGFSASSLSFDIKLLVGGITLIGSLIILSGLMQLLNSNSAWDKNLFILSLLGLSFVVMLIFMTIA